MAGNNSPTSSAMIAITTSSSTSENAETDRTVMVDRRADRRECAMDDYLRMIGQFAGKLPRNNGRRRAAIPSHHQPQKTSAADDGSGTDRNAASNAISKAAPE